MVATATHEYLDVPGGNDYYYQHWRFDHIHYFRYHDKFSFTFKGNVFKAIVLDSCGKAGFPQSHIWQPGLGGRIKPKYCRYILWNWRCK